MCNIGDIFTEILKDEINANDQQKLYNGVKRLIKKYSQEKRGLETLDEFVRVLTEELRWRNCCKLPERNHKIQLLLQKLLWMTAATKTENSSHLGVGWFWTEVLVIIHFYVSIVNLRFLSAFYRKDVQSFQTGNYVF